MDMIAGGLGAVLGIVVMVLLIVLWLLWIILPFMVNGIRKEVKQMRENEKAILLRLDMIAKGQKKIAQSTDYNTKIVAAANNIELEGETI